MIHATINATRILIGTAEECRAHYDSHPSERWRLWTESEHMAHMLASPEELQAIIERKRKKPGVYLQGGEYERI